MSKQHFSILLLVAVIVAAAVFLVPSRTSRDASVEPDVFLPALADVVNEIEQVRITANGGSEVVTLERRDDAWVVRESYDYPADWAVLRPLLADLSQAKVVEQKTSNPEYYHRLGVEDPAAEDAQSKLIEFPANDALPAVIVGDSAQGREGQYLRLQDQAASVLVDRAIELPVDATGWLQGDVVDVPDSEVVGVRVTHADGEVVEIQRNSPEVTDFTLNNLPEGRQTRSAWTLNQLASVLSALQLDAVSPVVDVNWDGAIALQVRTADGLVVDAWLAEDGEHRWIRLQAEGGEQADEINSRVEGWAYRIPLYKYDAVNKRMDDLLAEVDEESAE